MRLTQGTFSFLPDFTDEQIAACEMVADPDDLESKLLEEIEKAKGPRGRTIVAFSVR